MSAEIDDSNAEITKQAYLFLTGYAKLTEENQMLVMCKLAEDPVEWVKFLKEQMEKHIEVKEI